MKWSVLMKYRKSPYKNPLEKKISCSSGFQAKLSMNNLVDKTHVYIYKRAQNHTNGHIYIVNINFAIVVLP